MDPNLVKATGVATGTDTYAVLLSVKLTLKVGNVILVDFTNTNTGAVTLNPDGAGVIAVKRKNGSALASGDLERLNFLYYDGAELLMTSEKAGGLEFTSQVSGSAVISNAVVTLLETFTPDDGFGYLPIYNIDSSTPPDSDVEIGRFGVFDDGGGFGQINIKDKSDGDKELNFIINAGGMAGTVTINYRVLKFPLV